MYPYYDALDHGVDPSDRDESEFPCPYCNTLVGWGCKECPECKADLEDYNPYDLSDIYPAGV